MRFEFINAEKANHPVRVMCRVLQVSPSGSYAHIGRAPSHRQSEDAKLKPHTKRPIRKAAARTADCVWSRNWPNKASRPAGIEWPG